MIIICNIYNNIEGEIIMNILNVCTCISCTHISCNNYYLARKIDHKRASLPSKGGKSIFLAQWYETPQTCLTKKRTQVIK